MFSPWSHSAHWYERGSWPGLSGSRAFTSPALSSCNPEAVRIQFSRAIRPSVLAWGQARPSRTKCASRYRGCKRSCVLLNPLVLAEELFPRECSFSRSRTSPVPEPPPRVKAATLQKVSSVPSETSFLFSAELRSGRGTQTNLKPGFGGELAVRTLLRGSRSDCPPWCGGARPSRCWNSTTQSVSCGWPAMRGKMRPMSCSEPSVRG